MFFSTPLSGLNASSAALKTVSNNLSNMNTDGYKTENVTFSDLFYQNYGTSGGGDPIQAGLGVQVSGTMQDFGNGVLASTGTSANMALNGPGFFVTQTATGAQTFTRNGDFTTNSAGQLVTPSGALVMGYPAIGGVVSQNSGLQAVNVGSGSTSPATPTSTFSLNANLNASSPVGASFQSPVSIYDSLGTAHVLTITYTKTASNSWSYNVTLPSADLQGGTGTTTSVGNGALTFDSTGALSSPSGSVALSLGAFSDGASAQTVNWKLSGGAGTSFLTQTASSSSNNASSQDGFAAGLLSSYSVLTDGSVQGTFSNGQTRAIGQIAVASFANAEGLSMSGADQYTVTAASGNAVIGQAGTGGRGTIVGSAVEQSNVDVAQQFSNLIVYQRAYEANAKAITAFDQLEQATIAMKS